MNAALVTEIKAWIADDPDPVTASHLQQLLSLTVSFNLVPQVFEAQLVQAHRA